ncbi:hypothetical protein [uncultured Microbacterium sp.]|uniref:hypothetical protein n=1 Tax=uncultured Microbacterium sp. TaxID=191216 RepID=UPI0025F33218|nr:hypothetical protein [uncultured Microbacterium sp.]
MSDHADRVSAALMGSPAPRDLAWTDFVMLWKERADEVEEESGDRLAVRMNGHRVVFRRPHDGVVSIQDVEDARHLLTAQPVEKGEGRLLAVTMDDERARIWDFDLDATTVQDETHTLRDGDPRAHHLRTVERHTGRDDERDLVHYFDEVADRMQTEFAGRRFVLFGHGDGTSDAAALFAARLRKEHPLVAGAMIAEERIDLSAATPADIEAAAQKAAARG